MSRTSRRSRPLPPGWATTRRRILNRDQHTCHVCGQPGADQVDHVIPAINGGTDDDTNLAAIHDNPCHRRKTAREAAAHTPRIPRTREPEPHPGMTPPPASGSKQGVGGDSPSRGAETGGG